MIRVTVIDDKRIIESVFTPAEDMLMAWAQENEKNSGYCIFKKTGEIVAVKDNDDVFELLIRATLNYLDLNGVGIGFSENEELFEGLEKLGFSQKSKACEVDIKTFFKPCCNH